MEFGDTSLGTVLPAYHFYEMIRGYYFGDADGRVDKDKLDWAGCFGWRINNFLLKKKNPAGKSFFGGVVLGGLAIWL